GWKARDLQGVLVSLGPGSYTGLRVGIMSAKTLCYAVGCPLIGIETFAAIAVQASAETDNLEVLADAQQDKRHVQPFVRVNEGTWQPTAPLRIRTIEEWLAARDADAWVSGPGIDAHAERLPSGLKLVEPALRSPRPDSLLRLGLQRFQAGKQDDVWTLE